MIPVLFKKNEQQYRTYGLGEITDIIKPKVTRERNGQYQLYFQYPQDAELSDIFEEDMRIKSDAGVRTKWQTFEISRVVRQEGQLIEVFAKHISQSLLKDALNPAVNVRTSSAEQALRIWNNNRIGDETFDVWSDITTTNSTRWDIRDVSNAFEALAGVQGSILDVWGGEYEFDNKMIRLHREMGRKAPVPLEYGRNITNVEQDIQDDNVYTSVYPFAVYTPEDADEPKTVTISERYVDGKYLDMHNKRKIQVVDFSGEFEYDDVPTGSQLRTLTNQYLESNEVGLPHENLKVEYIDLAKTLDYQDFQTMEEIELNDRLPIFYPKFGVTNENAKAVVVNYDPVKEENISIELGAVGQSFRNITTGGIGSRLDRVEQHQNETDIYIVNSRGNRIWYTPPPEDREHDIGDTWFEENGQYTRIRIWNGDQWIIEIDTEDVDKVAKEVERQQEEISETKEQADHAVEQIDVAVENAGFTTLDETISSVQSITNAAQASADVARDHALDALSGANTAMTDARSAIDTANSVQSLAHDLSGQVSDFELTVDSFNQTINDYEGQVSQFQNDVAGLESTVANYEIELDEYGNLVDTYATEVSSMRNTVDGFESTVASYGDEVAEYADDVSRYESQVSTFKNTVDGLNSTVANYEIELDEYGNVVSQYATQVSQFENTVDGLTSEIATYQEDVQGYEAKVVTLENTVNGFNSTVQRVESDYNDLSGTVRTHTTQISNMDGRISAKANQDTVDTLEGTVSSLGTDIGVVAGQISSKVWNTDIETAIDDLNYENRNLLVESELIKGRYINSSTTYQGRVSGSGFFITPPKPIDGAKYLTASITVNLPLENLRIMFLDSNLEKISYHSKISGLSQTWEVPSNSEYYVFCTHDRDGNKYKLEKGTKATDWSPAPEDTDAKFSYIETEWTQTFDSFSQTVAGIDGRVTAQKQTIDSISSTVSGHGNRISTVEQTASGLQSTVASKASQSQVTQLANGLNALVKEQTENLIPKERNLTDNYSSWSKESSITFNRILNNRTELFVGIRDQRIWYSLTLEQGKKYKITFEARAHVTGREISVGRGTKNTQRIPLRSSVTSYEVIFESDASSDFSIFFHAAGTYEIGNVQVVETTAISSAQLSVLSDNINLRVTKGDVLSQINIEAGRTLIQSDKLLLDAQTVAFSGSAFIPSAAIESLTADKINTGELNGANVRIVNLDFNTAVGNRTQFVQSAWNNAVGGNVSISGSGIVTTASNGAQGLIQNGVFLSRRPNGSTLGYIGYGQQSSSGSPYYTINLSYGAHFRIRNHLGSENYQTTFHINSSAEYAEFNVNRVHYRKQITVSNHSILAETSDKLVLNGNRSVDMRASNQTIFTVSASGGTGYMRMFNAINMNGYYVTNQSDFRLKEDIENTKLDSLESIKKWNFVDYEWIDSNKPRGVQFGLIAQETPEINMYDSNDDAWSINSSKQLMMTTHAVQQLSLAHDNTNLVASEALINSETNAEKIERLEKRIEELESAA